MPTEKSPRPCRPLPDDYGIAFTDNPDWKRMRGDGSHADEVHHEPVEASNHAS